MGSPERLSFLRSALLRELGGNETRLRFINTRLILSVGVDLNDITHNDEHDQRKIALTLESLVKMGFLAKEASRG